MCGVLYNQRADSSSILASVQVKLRRVEQGAAWEVVNMRDMGQRRTLGRSQVVVAALRKVRNALLFCTSLQLKGDLLCFFDFYDL